MLMPSALPCDSSHTAPVTRLQSALFASPPPSPPQVPTQAAIGSLFTSCRSLQSLLASPPPLSIPSAGPEPITPPASSHAQLSTPPMTHALPPLKLRLRSRKTDNTTTGSADHAPARKRIVKRSAAVAPARGLNKRRRATDDDMGRYNSNHSDAGYDSNSDMEQDQQPQHELENPFYLQRQQQDKENEPQDDTPHTPKRSRIAPEVLPLGLERTDYHLLHTRDRALQTSNSSNNIPTTDGTDVVLENDGEPWSTEEDRMLVELVLEKLKLSKSDWQDCARSLGKDRGSVGRRWKSLMLNGDVGLNKGSSRRPRLHGTWR